MNVKYLLGTALLIPCAPILYLQGQRVKRSLPEFQEAQKPQGTARPSTSEKPEKPPFRLLCLGESTKAGVGVDTHEEGFSGSMAQLIADQQKRVVEWRVHAKSGSTAAGLTHKIVPTIDAAEADLLIIGIGANNAFRFHKPSKWRKDMIDLTESLRKKFPHTPIAFLNMPPIKAFPAFPGLMQFFVGNLVELFGQELEELIKPYNSVYYNSAALAPDEWPQKWGLAADPNTFFSDGIHPSALTYQLWAKDFYDFLNSNTPIFQS